MYLVIAKLKVKKIKLKIIAILFYKDLNYFLKKTSCFTDQQQCVKEVYLCCAQISISL